MFVPVLDCHVWCLRLFYFLFLSLCVGTNLVKHILLGIHESEFLFFVSLFNFCCCCYLVSFGLKNISFHNRKRLDATLQDLEEKQNSKKEAVSIFFSLCFNTVPFTIHFLAILLNQINFTLKKCTLASVRLEVISMLKLFE